MTRHRIGGNTRPPTSADQVDALLAEPDPAPVVVRRRREDGRRRSGRKRGTYERARPGTTPEELQLKPGQVWNPLTHVHPDPVVDRREYLRAAVNDTVPDDHMCLRLLRKEERMKWLAYMVVTPHAREQIVSLGPGLGHEVVSVMDNRPNLVCMELLMRAQGDFAQASVSIGDGAQVVLVVGDNGRGPIGALGSGDAE
jgi:hypothetical protein